VYLLVLSVLVLVLCCVCFSLFSFFFFNDPATTEIYTLSLHDALPIFPGGARARQLDHGRAGGAPRAARPGTPDRGAVRARGSARSEEHTSELQSRFDLVCRLLLEKKKKKKRHQTQQIRQHASSTYKTT